MANAVKEATTATAPEIIALTTPKKPSSVKTVVLFSIDGKEYAIPSKVRPNKALQIMHVFRTQGATNGVDFMLETLLGHEGYTALLGYDELEDENLEKIIKIAFELVNGAVSDGPKA